MREFRGQLLWAGRARPQMAQFVAERLRSRSVVVVPCGALVPCCGIDCVGAQPVAFLAGADGAV